MSKGKTITKEIRIHIRHHHCWVEYETKTGRITKIEANDLPTAYSLAGALASNAEEWLEESKTEEQ